MRESSVKLKKQPGELFKRVSTRAVSECIQQQTAPQLMDDGGFAHPLDEYRGSPFDSSEKKTDFLLVDCREAEDYEKCHIKGALYYPKTRIYHGTNPFLTEMYAFKNKENKMIVLYDLEEERVAALANTIFEKGVDNIAILAGGLREFVQDYSSYIDGESPVPIVPRDARLQRRADQITQARSEARTSISHSKPKSLSNSLAKPAYR
ncbi:hypothetical protein STCU_04327 [Strigomonas culicis]|uniref:Rhodanese domain-containing protein n=1 Tax=Strigomonas culicis TaxID=28005 RepID=S9UGF9_9TRYP|nr:hypothetical protein STCU_04327 [Strigomonas culicis]|eukprot:EPY29917.1 hypothetical protein STCU_04327 [Strigomonas culicis]